MVLRALGLKQITSVDEFLFPLFFWGAEEKIKTSHQDSHHSLKTKPKVYTCLIQLEAKMSIEQRPTDMNHIDYGWTEIAWMHLKRTSLSLCLDSRMHAITLCLIFFFVLYFILSINCSQYAEISYKLVINLHRTIKHWMISTKHFQAL